MLFFFLSSDLINSGLGSPEVLPSVLEHGTAAADVNSPLEQEDEAFVLLPTPRGMKTYCIIQRTRSVTFTSRPASRRHDRRGRLSRRRRCRCFFFFPAMTTDEINRPASTPPHPSPPHCTVPLSSPLLSSLLLFSSDDLPVAVYCSRN